MAEASAFLPNAATPAPVREAACVDEMREREAEAGMTTAAYYAGFQAKADKLKNDFLGFLLDASHRGKAVAAYGAAAKGNTLMNYAGVRPDLISFVVDRNPSEAEQVHARQSHSHYERRPSA